MSIESLAADGLVVGKDYPLPTRELPFHPASANSTVALIVSTSATTAPVALPALSATSYRVRIDASSGATIYWTVSTSSATAPVIPTAYSAAGTGGSAGTKGIDPGGIELFGLTPAQQAALAAGTLYLSAISTTAGKLWITLGTGA